MVLLLVRDHYGVNQGSESTMMSLLFVPKEGVQVLAKEELGKKASMTLVPWRV